MRSGEDACLARRSEAACCGGFTLSVAAAPEDPAAARPVLAVGELPPQHVHLLFTMRLSPTATINV